MTDRELMQMALDAMESFESGTNGLYKGEFAEERKALRDRLAHPEREWVGLTDEEIIEVVGQITTYRGEYMVCVGNAIEAKLKEKNS
jgi:hypothetical protein